MIRLLKNILGKLFGLDDPAYHDPAVGKAILIGAFLVDVRTPREFEAGSAKGAVNIPLSEIKHRIDELKDQESIVVFCRSGNRSGKAKNILNQNGITNVINGGTWKSISKIQDHYEI